MLSFITQFNMPPFLAILCRNYWPEIGSFDGQEHIFIYVLTLVL